MIEILMRAQGGFAAGDSPRGHLERNILCVDLDSSDNESEDTVEEEYERLLSSCTADISGERSVEIVDIASDGETEKRDSPREEDVVPKISSGVKWESGNTHWKPYPCKYCSRDFISEKGLFKHTIRHEGLLTGRKFLTEGHYQCEHCLKVFPLKHLISKHMKIHTEISSGRPLKKNLAIHRKKDILKCALCPKTFLRKVNLAKHILCVHNADDSLERDFSCEHCSSTYDCKRELANHMHAHLFGRVISECGQCFKTFRCKSELALHIRTHTGEKPYQCQQCPKAFSESSQLNSHIRIHTGEKPYHCKQCPKVFAHRSPLTVHIRSHTGEKPFKCQQCPMAFAQRGHITIHTRIHTGEKPYQCQQCPKAFAQCSQLNSHIRIHTGEKPYHCEQCPKVFAHSSSLKAHLTNHHTTRSTVQMFCKQ